MNFDDLKKKLRLFAEERDWKQFHSPKNLSMALAVEAAELLEHFQWLTQEQSKSLDRATREEVETEIADVQIYLTMLADRLQIDIARAVNSKIGANAEKYPVNKLPTENRK